jgi:NADPH:quinone reductase-like Zn-dependent oxidoreductase
VVRVADCEVPEPRPNEVRIRVAYAGLAFADKMLRLLSVPGIPKPPLTPGADISGEIDAVGAQVSSLRERDRVVALLMSDFGGQAEYLCIDSSRVMVVPPEVPLDKAVCLMVNYLTAHRMLALALQRVPRGPMLVHGGAGGVGSAMLQLARAQGIDVVATVSSGKRRPVEALGALAVDYATEDFGDQVRQQFPDGVTAVFDPIGGDYVRRSLAVLQKGGTYIGYGFQKGLSQGRWGLLKTLALFLYHKLTSPGRSLQMFQLRDNKPEANLQDVTALFELYQRGKIDPLVAQVFPLEQAREAHGYLDRGLAVGKVLLAASA